MIKLHSFNCNTRIYIKFTSPLVTLSALFYLLGQSFALRIPFSNIPATKLLPDATCVLIPYFVVLLTLYFIFFLLFERTQAFDKVEALVDRLPKKHQKVLFGIEIVALIFILLCMLVRVYMRKITLDVWDVYFYLFFGWLLFFSFMLNKLDIPDNQLQLYKTISLCPMILLFSTFLGFHHGQGSLGPLAIFQHLQ